MFSFDITVIIQMINFFIAWWFLDRFLFKKLIFEVHQEDSFVAGLQRKLDEESHNLAAVVDQKKVELEQFKHVYKEQIPALSHPIIEAQEISFNPPDDMKDHERSVLINEISEQLVQEISHD